jgi:hypothetical protein
MGRSVTKPSYRVSFSTVYGKWRVRHVYPDTPGRTTVLVITTETLSEAVEAAQEHAGRALEFVWADDFQSGEGQ